MQHQLMQQRDSKQMIFSQGLILEFKAFLVQDKTQFEGIK